VKTFVKLCGLTEAEVCRAVPDGGAAGFVIGVEASPRNVTPERAAELVAEVPNGAEVWAVVANPSAELIHSLFDSVGVDRVQVYGPIPDGLEFLEVHHLVPSLPVGPAESGLPAPPVPPAESFPRIHLDAAGDPLPGGSGTRPDWAICAGLIESNPGRKFVLAGALTAANVAEALAAVRPWGVDVSAGVEDAPGHKDVAKIRAFLQAVEAHEKTNA
jgi:phosphoribosylanthranilate isomerase